jgi:hypothetical protein
MIGLIFILLQTISGLALVVILTYDWFIESVWNNIILAGWIYLTEPQRLGCMRAQEYGRHHIWSMQFSCEQG